MKKIDYKKYFPPGMDWRKEMKQFSYTLIFMTGVAFAFALGGFFRRLKPIKFYLEIGGTLEDAQNRGFFVPKFTELLGPLSLCFMIIIIACVVKMLLYRRFFSQGAKSLYTMKRLPQKNELLQRTVIAPLCAIAFALVVFALCGLLFYIIYQGVMPAEWLDFIGKGR